MGDRMTVLRKIARWDSYTPPVEWTAVLECGHTVPSEYDDGLSDDTKAFLEKRGSVECSECSDKQSRIRALEGELKNLKKDART